MIDPRRRRMLEEMGLTVWRSRAPADPPDAATEPAEPDAGADASSPALDWDGLRAGIEACQRCPLHATRQHAVPGVGDRAARLMIIGEAPGAEEDRRGEPFVGRAGQLLDAMLAAIGLNRHDGVFITNVIKSRPPENRDPGAEEIAACRPWLDAQIALIQPAVILAVGKVAGQSLTGSRQPMGKLREHWHELAAGGTPLRATYHPAYLLRRPEAKAKAWEDLLAVRRALREGSV